MRAPGSNPLITFRADLRHSSGPNASPRPGSGFMRQQPGLIQPYCLIKNKFPSNLLFCFSLLFFFFCLPIKLPAAQSEGEAGEWGEEAEIYSSGCCAGHLALGAGARWKVILGTRPCRLLESEGRRGRHVGRPAGLLSVIIPQPDLGF